MAVYLLQYPEVVLNCVLGKKNAYMIDQRPTAPQKQNKQHREWYKDIFIFGILAYVLYFVNL